MILEKIVRVAVPMAARIHKLLKLGSTNRGGVRMILEKIVRVATAMAACIHKLLKLGSTNRGVG